MTELLKPGIYDQLPAEYYHQPRLGVVSKSALDMLRKTPAHYRAWASGEFQRSTPALTFGRAGHCAVFEPDEFARLYVEEPDFGDRRYKENKQALAKWREENADREHLPRDDAAKIRAIQKSIHGHELVRRMLHEGKAERTIIWQDQQTGLTCKSRTDYHVEKLGLVADLKLVEDASWPGFRKSIARYYYHVQDALYREGFHALGKPIKHFVFIAIEKTPPYASAVYALDADGIARGYQAARDGIQHMAECVKTDTWPGYPTGIQTISLPDWAS